MARAVLIIDDDPVTLKLLEVHFLRRGWNVLTAANGTVGMDLAIQKKPDILITDMLLPGTHGVDVCRMVRNNPELDGMRLVMMTSVYRNISDRNGDLDCDRDGFLEKPIDLKALDDTIDSLTH